MSIGANWGEVWKPVWKEVWTPEGAPPVEVPTVTITLQSKAEPGAQRMAGLTALKWAFFDAVSPADFGAPVDSGSIEATDGSGTAVIALPNTTLTSGQTGWLVLTDSDGTTTQNPPPRSFCAPVTVD